MTASDPLRSFTILCFLRRPFGKIGYLSAMNYSTRANLVNIFFIALILLAPIGYCLYDTSVPPEIGPIVIVWSFLLTAFVIADWYHLYSSNSFSGALRAIGFGVIMIVISLSITAVVTGLPVTGLAMFENVEYWDGMSWLLRAYVAGIGVSAAAVVGIIRLSVLRGLGESDLPAQAKL